MSIELNPISSGYSTGLINENFQKLEEEINNNVLRRGGLSPGEANQMEVTLDMNSNQIINVVTDVNSPSSLLTVSEGDLRYVNITGDSMQGSLNMDSYPLFVRIATNGNEPARKDELDAEKAQRASNDANLQSQLTGVAPLEASTFSPINWHDQTIKNSVTIPANKNAWSAGPVMALSDGVVITIGTDSRYTVLNGSTV